MQVTERLPSTPTPRLVTTPLWQILPSVDLPPAFVQAVQKYGDIGDGRRVAQLLWQRGIRDLQQVAGFINPDAYQPTSPFAFGEEMRCAVERLQLACDRAEKVAVWGDFDADGVTATAVLWEGLGQFFSRGERLLYWIPNRLTESHGLAIAGLNALADQGVRLIVTCDTGSTNLTEIQYASDRGIEVIVTDHHTLPESRPPVVALINPRSLESDHPLAHLSGVAVAYKLVEVLYETLPDVPQKPLDELLDLVAIGLIADLVELRGDCRYLAQRGIDQLQRNQSRTPPPRPGIARLLELCQRNGDRPTDISFGIGPRINAISRIHGDARFAVELLTSQDAARCRELAEKTELANTRRKALQKDVAKQVRSRVEQLDLSTTSVIVLADPQWSPGVLGLVAGQIAQEFGRPTILLCLDSPTADEPSTDPETLLLARGSARSANQIDLYQLVKAQSHLLHGFGGHPFAAGLSLPISNLPLFTEAINRELRQQQFALGEASGVVIQADLTVTVSELSKDRGKALFRQLKVLEPYGIGNPVPRLLIQNCWFRSVRNRNIQDLRGRKVRYIKTEFELWDDSAQQGFPGIWWEHYQTDIPPTRCDAIAELDFNTYQKRYELRLVALRPQDELPPAAQQAVDWLIDWRDRLPESPPTEAFAMMHCPSSWDELQVWFRQARHANRPLAIAYPPPTTQSPTERWEQLVGIAKYLSRTGKPALRTQLLEKLEMGDRALQFGFQALQSVGFTITTSNEGFYFSWQPEPADEPLIQSRIDRFLAALQEEQFRRQYFYALPLPTLQRWAISLT